MKIMIINVREENVYPLSVELLSGLAHREVHDPFPNVLEHENLEQELCTIRLEIVAYSPKTGESNILLRTNKWIESQWAIERQARGLLRAHLSRLADE